MIIKGKAIKYGDNIDTDVIIPARYLNTTSPEELAKHCLEDLDPDFLKKVICGDILVVGENFGCGSSREHAPMAIKGSGISAIIAKSYARIFYRNAINTGLAIFECEEAPDNIQSDDIIEIDAATGIITNLSQNLRWNFIPPSPFIQKIISAGGLINYITDTDTDY